MIRLSRLDGSEFFLNADQIQTVEESPDTHILLTNGQRYVVREPAATVADRVVAYQRRVHLTPYLLPVQQDEDRHTPDRLPASHDPHAR